MNTTKCFRGLIVLLGILAGSLNSAAQEEGLKKNNKVHLKITQEIDGKTISVDTTFTPDQHESVMSHLGKMGFSIAPPPSPPAAPPHPPHPPHQPAPPSPPSPPSPPVAPGKPLSDYKIIIGNDYKMTPEEKERFEKAMEKLKTEIRDIKIPDLPDLSNLKIPNIEFDENMFEGVELEKVKIEMKNLDEEMKKLDEKLRHIRIEIKEQKDSPGGKDGGYYYDYKYENDHSHDFGFYPGSNGSRFHVFDHDSLMAALCLVKISDGGHVYEYSYKIKDPAERTGKVRHENPVDPSNSYRLSATAFNVFPNPGDGKFNLAFTLPEGEPVEIKVMDAAGKTVFEKNLADFDGICQEEIDIAEMGKGMYLLTVTQGEKWMHKKLIVK